MTEKREVVAAQLQEFRPPDLARILETAGEADPPTLQDVGRMAGQSIVRLLKQPPGECRDAELEDAQRTLDDVAAAYRKGKP